MPTFEGARTEADDLCTAAESGSVLGGFFDEGEEVFALFESA